MRLSMLEIENQVVMRNGYGIRDPQEMEGEPWGVDAMGDEILYGDKYVDLDGEIVLLDNLQEYWEKNCDVETAK